MSLDQFLLSSNTTDLNYPEIRPTLDLNFARVKALDPRITFTRASGGSYVGADGLIKYAGVNEPRFDHDPVTGESLGFLVEEARTNLTLYSGDFSQAHWSKISLSIFTANTIIAPDGTLTGSFIAFQNATSPLTGAQGLQPNTTISAGTNTLSCFAKIGTARYLALGLTNNGGEVSTAIFDLQTGTVNGSGSHPSFTVNGTSMVSAGAGWYRCSLTSTYAAGMAAHISSSTSGLSGTYGASVSGDGTSGIYVWGAQIEASASFPTSYIPTEGSSRTRAADLASITGKNFSSWFSSSSGSLVSIAKTPPGVAWRYAQIIGGFGNGIYSQSSTGTGMLVDGFHANGPWQSSGRVWILGVSYSLGGNLNFGYNDYTLQSRNAFIAWSPTESRYGINGELSSGSSSSMASTVAATVNKFIIGYGDNIDAYYQPPSTVHVKRLTFYPKRLTNQQLQVLTR